MNCSKCDLYFSSPGCLSIHEKSCRLSKSLINHLKNDYINGLSIRKLNLKYAEKVFLNKIKDIEYDKKYKIEREKSVFPFYIDFAFIEQKLAIEIDGSQHLLPDRVLSDERKDTFLKENGWIIVRFTASEVIKNVDLVISKLDSLLNATIE